MTTILGSDNFGRPVSLGEVSSLEGDNDDFPMMEKPGEWNLKVWKMQRSQWGYFLENPQGGGGGQNTSYRNAEQLIKWVLSRVPTHMGVKEGDKVWVIVGVSKGNPREVAKAYYTRWGGTGEPIPRGESIGEASDKAKRCDFCKRMRHDTISPEYGAYGGSTICRSCEKREDDERIAKAKRDEKGAKDEAIGRDDVPRQHQLKIALSTLKMNRVFGRIMGGMDHEQAIQFLVNQAGYSRSKVEGLLKKNGFDQAETDELMSLALGESVDEGQADQILNYVKQGHGIDDLARRFDLSAVIARRIVSGSPTLDAIRDALRANVESIGEGEGPEHTLHHIYKKAFESARLRLDGNIDKAMRLDREIDRLARLGEHHGMADEVLVAEELGRADGEHRDQPRSWAEVERTIETDLTHEAEAARETAVFALTEALNIPTNAEHEIRAPRSYGNAERAAETVMVPALKLAKATIFMPGSMFGNWNKVEVNDLVVWSGPYAQHQHALHVQFRAKGKRKTVGRSEGSHPRLVVYAGWGIDLSPESMFNAPEQDGPVTVQRGRRSAFDKGWDEEMQQRVADYAKKPVMAVFEALEEVGPAFGYVPCEVCGKVVIHRGAKSKECLSCSLSTPEERADSRSRKKETEIEYRKQHGARLKRANQRFMAGENPQESRLAEAPTSDGSPMFQGADGEGVSVDEIIKVGDRVTIRTPQGQTRSGRAVMHGPGGWVLNLGGAHGTPGIASDRNVVSVKRGGKWIYGNAKSEAAGDNIEQARAGGKALYPDIDTVPLSTLDKGAKFHYPKSSTVFEKVGDTSIKDDGGRRWKAGRHVAVVPESIDEAETGLSEGSDDKDAEGFAVYEPNPEDGETNVLVGLYFERRVAQAHAREINQDIHRPFPLVNARVTRVTGKRLLDLGGLVRMSRGGVRTDESVDEATAPWVYVSWQDPEDEGGKVYAVVWKKRASPSDITKGRAYAKTLNKGRVHIGDASTKLDQIKAAQAAGKTIGESDESIGKGKNGYVAFYKGKRYEVYGDTTLGARNALAAELKIPAKKHHEINIMLAEIDGKTVTHTPSEGTEEAFNPALRKKLRSKDQDTRYARMLHHGVKKVKRGLKKLVSEQTDLEPALLEALDDAHDFLDQCGLLEAEDPAQRALEMLQSADTELVGGLQDGLDKLSKAVRQAQAGQASMQKKLGVGATTARDMLGQVVKELKAYEALVGRMLKSVEGLARMESVLECSEDFDALAENIPTDTPDFKGLKKLPGRRPLHTNAGVNRDRAMEMFKAGMKPEQIAKEFGRAFFLNDGKLGQRYDSYYADGTKETRITINADAVDKAIARHKAGEPPDDSDESANESQFIDLLNGTYLHIEHGIVDEDNKARLLAESGVTEAKKLRDTPWQQKKSRYGYGYESYIDGWLLDIHLGYYNTGWSWSVYDLEGVKVAEGAIPQTPHTDQVGLAKTAAYKAYTLASASAKA